MKILVISFSGGRTSGYMTKRILDEKRKDYDGIYVIFANTGLENEQTLEFVNQCDLNFDFNTIWVEALVNPQHGEGIRHSVVNFANASRNGEPFYEMAKKYGIPNLAFPMCTKNLKRYPIESYIREVLGLKSKQYDLAIGIRSDERRRVKYDKTRRVVYPLVDWFPADKQDVISWWEDQSFDLQLQEHQGNCKTCWKKSFKKLMMLYQEDPSQFDHFDRMEKLYGLIGPEFVKDSSAMPRVFFRGNLSVPHFKVMAEEHMKYQKTAPIQLDLYANSGCSESCELFETEEFAE